MLITDQTRSQLDPSSIFLPTSTSVTLHNISAIHFYFQLPHCHQRTERYIYPLEGHCVHWRIWYLRHIIQTEERLFIAKNYSLRFVRIALFMWKFKRGCEWDLQPMGDSKEFLVGIAMSVYQNSGGSGTNWEAFESQKNWLGQGYIEVRPWGLNSTELNTTASTDICPGEIFVILDWARLTHNSGRSDQKAHDREDWLVTACLQGCSAPLLGKLAEFVCLYRVETSVEGHLTFGTITRQTSLCAANLNSNCFRISLEWSRIEPKRGQVDPHGVQRYREIFQCLQRSAILHLSDVRNCHLFGGSHAGPLSWCP